MSAPVINYLGSRALAKVMKLIAAMLVHLFAIPITLQPDHICFCWNFHLSSFLAQPASPGFSFSLSFLSTPTG